MQTLGFKKGHIADLSVGNFLQKGV